MIDHLIHWAHGIHTGIVTGTALSWFTISTDSLILTSKVITEPTYGQRDPSVVERYFLCDCKTFSCKCNNLNFILGANPQLIQYALRVYGTTDLDEDKWRQCEDQIKVFLILQESKLKLNSIK